MEVWGLEVAFSIERGRGFGVRSFGFVGVCFLREAYKVLMPNPNIYRGYMWNCEDHIDIYSVFREAKESML